MASVDSRSGTAAAGTALAAVLLIMNGIMGVTQGVGAKKPKTTQMLNLAAAGRWAAR